jgi:hypothetical protein
MAKKSITRLDGSTYIEEYVPEPAPPATIQDYENAIQSMVDEAARSRRYADGKSMDGYVTSTVPAWASEAQAFVAWRDNVWQYAYSELAKVQTKKRKQPSVQDFLQELPAIVWP